MKIVADENMPLLEECFGQFGELIRLPGRTIKKNDLNEADVLLVRSVTQVNEHLLENTAVRFVGTATIGTDHLDRAWLNAHQIHNVSAPGCNADSVADWVVASLAHWSLKHGKELNGLKAGILGHGNVGSRVEKRLNSLGLSTLVSDPPKAIRDPNFCDASLDSFGECDILCLHAPLVLDGEHPTRGLINETLLSKLKDGALVLSAGRGPVLDVASVTKHLGRLVFFLDVWDPEPDIPQHLLAKVDQATPHIAGYSLQSKWRGTEMLYREFCLHFGKQITPITHPMTPPTIKIPQSISDWRKVVLHLYDPHQDFLRTKETLLNHPEAGPAFDLLRKNYPLRHEFSFPLIDAPHLPQVQKDTLNKLGFRFIHD